MNDPLLNELQTNDPTKTSVEINFHQFYYKPSPAAYGVQVWKA